MKKSLIILLVLIINIFLIGFISAEIRINEVELNPYGSPDAGNEWIELYSSEEINITTWEIRSTNGRNMSFNASFSGYYIFNTSYLLLTDENNKLFLYNNNSSLIFSTDIFSDKENNQKTWQYCNGSWRFNYMTRGFENNCTISQTNNTQNPSDNPDSNSEEPEVSLEADWEDDEIVNGEEFEIELIIEDMEDRAYNIKIWIEDDDGKIINDRYGEDSNGDDKWKSGNYYIYNLFKGPGDDKETVKLRIRKGYEDFSGDATLFFKIEGEEEEEEDIEILKNEEQEAEINNTKTKTNPNPSKATSTITGDSIKLESSESEEKVVYESKSEKIKLYSLIGFVVLFLIFLLLVIFKSL